MKLPIAFTSLISGVPISQKPDIFSGEDIVGASSSPLNFSYRLFTMSHVPDISLPKIPHFDLDAEGDLPKVPSLYGTARSQVLLELLQVSKSL